MSMRGIPTLRRLLSVVPLTPQRSILTPLTDMLATISPWAENAPRCNLLEVSVHPIHVWS